MARRSIVAFEKWLAGELAAAETDRRTLIAHMEELNRDIRVTEVRIESLKAVAAKLEAPADGEDDEEVVDASVK